MAKAAGKTVEEAPKKSEEKKPGKFQSREVVTVKSGALSTDVAPLVLAGLQKTFVDEEKAHALLQGVADKRYDLLSQTTAAILKAAKVDDSIDLSAAFSGDVKKMNVLNDQLGIALGFREVTIIPAEGDKPEIKRIGTAKAVAKYFPGPKDDKNSPEYKRKNTLRSNWLHMVKKCAQAASGLLATDTKVEMNKEAGTLQISGPAVKKQFGQETVLLNEKQTIGEGEQAVKLAARPSFIAVAKMGAEAAGKVLQPRAQSGTGTKATDPGAAVQAIAKSLTEACSKLKLPADDETKRALSIAQNAIDKVLKGSQPA